MGLFSSNKPVVSRKEFVDKIRVRLYGMGFTSIELDRIEEIFRGDFDNDISGNAPGITEPELVSAFNWMRENKATHKMSDSKIEMLEKEMQKFL